ncbi:mitochondrial carrier domain-containing protein [Mycena leptocephala]|nr:mitochondrial carrier domain-containing protein [Mycena leptocephala]
MSAQWQCRRQAAPVPWKHSACRYGSSPPVRGYLLGHWGGGIAGFVGNPGEIVMVRLQGDFAKPPEKWFNYKNCFDALFRVRFRPSLSLSSQLFVFYVLTWVHRWSAKKALSSLARGIGPNVFHAILMNASQLASLSTLPLVYSIDYQSIGHRYDFFKAELLKTKYFEDNIMCHFTASFAAGTVVTTVCSPTDVLKSRIMNASGPGSNSTFGIIRTSFKTEGAMFMFKGWQLENGVDWMRGRGIEVL